MATLGRLPPAARQTLVTLACATAVAWAAPASAQAAKGMEVAISDDPVFLARHYYDTERALQNARELGVTRMRVFVNWAGVMDKQSQSAEPPAEPTYYWGIYENLIDVAARAGIRVQLNLTGPAPAFATGDKKVGMNRPDAGQFAAFARAAAARFKGRIDRYSLWNEPNHDGWLKPMAEAPRVYRALYAAGYKAIRSADPAAAVLFAETAPYAGTRAMAPLDFLRRTLCLNAKYKRDKKCLSGMPEGARGSLRADGYAHHPYDFRNAPNYKFRGKDNVTIGTLSRLTGALDRAARAKALMTPRGRRAPFVYLTEFGYFATGKRATVPESKRRKWLPQAFAIAQRNPRVKQMLHYGLVAPPPHYGYASAFDFGLLATDGTPRGTYGPLVKWAQGAMRKRQVVSPGGPIALPAAQPGADPPGEPPPEEPPLIPPIPFP